MENDLASGEKRQIRTAGSFTVNDGQSLLNAAINGLEIAYLPSFLYASALAEGRVVDVMPELPKETKGIYVVYPPGKFTQTKVRTFIDYLAQTFARKVPDHCWFIAKPPLPRGGFVHALLVSDCWPVGTDMQFLGL